MEGQGLDQRSWRLKLALISCIVLAICVRESSAETKAATGKEYTGTDDEGSYEYSDVSEDVSYDYSGVLALGKSKGISFADLPGFTRSVYERDHALVTPESRVFTTPRGWKNADTAHLISAAVGANFAMYLATMHANSTAGQPASDVERFVFMLDGLLTLSGGAAGAARALHAGDYAYLPPNSHIQISSFNGAGFLVYERKYAQQGGKPVFQTGVTDEQPTLPCAGEVFLLRKLLPQTADYDFNVHVMDFLPGEFLNVKEVHYNQHGLLLLQGQGIYRLADKWYPVQAGDAIWMAPYVVQWYAALGTQNSRYIIYKDTTLDPLDG